MPSLLRVPLLFLLLSVSLWLCCRPAQAQPCAYRNLVLEGGGIRGIAYGGALQELQNRGVLRQIKRVGGTSAGAIQAALLSVGYLPSEVTLITYSTPVKQFNDGRLIFFGGFTRLFRQFGWYRGDKLSRWLGERLKAKAGTADLTFAQLHQLAWQEGFRDLYVLATNLSTQQPVVLSHETYPHMKVRDAVRASASIPLYFRAVLIDSAGKVLKRPTRHAPYQVLVDGGIVANFPIRLFDEPRFCASDTGMCCPIIPGEPNRETLGIRLDSDEQIAYDRAGKGLAPAPISNFREYMGAFYQMVLENLNRQQLTPADWERTISVSTAGIGPRIRRMSEDEKAKLLNSGQEGARKFFGK